MFRLREPAPGLPWWRRGGPGLGAQPAPRPPRPGSPGPSAAPEGTEGTARRQVLSGSLGCDSRGIRVCEATSWRHVCVASTCSCHVRKLVRRHGAMGPVPAWPPSPLVITRKPGSAVGSWWTAPLGRQCRHGPSPSPDRVGGVPVVLERKQQTLRDGPQQNWPETLSLGRRVARAGLVPGRGDGRRAQHHLGYVRIWEHGR